MNKVAVIGAGNWGKNLVRNFYELEALAVVADPSEKGRQHVQRISPEIPVIDRFDFKKPYNGLDTVVIATPAATHYELCKQALEADMDVLCEKPLSLTADQARELEDLAGERESILMVGHVLEYHPAFLKIRELIDAGTLGSLRYIYSNRLNLGKVRTEENILWSFAPHDIALLLRMVGAMPEKVHAHGKAFLQKGIHDVTLTHLDFPENIQAHIHVSWLHPFKEHLFVVIGSERMITFNDVTKNLELYDQRVDIIDGIPTPHKAEPERIAYADEEPLKNECRAFLEAVETREPPLTDARSAVQVLEVLQQAQEALEED